MFNLFLANIDTALQAPTFSSVTQCEFPMEQVPSCRHSSTYKYFLMFKNMGVLKVGWKGQFNL